MLTCTPDIVYQSFFPRPRNQPRLFTFDHPLEVASQVSSFRVEAGVYFVAVFTSSVVVNPSGPEVFAHGYQTSCSSSSGTRPSGRSTTSFLSLFFFLSVAASQIRRRPYALLAGGQAVPSGVRNARGWALRLSRGRGARGRLLRRRVQAGCAREFWLKHMLTLTLPLTSPWTAPLAMYLRFSRADLAGLRTAVLRLALMWFAGGNISLGHLICLSVSLSLSHPGTPRRRAASLRVVYRYAYVPFHISSLSLHRRVPVNVKCTPRVLFVARCC